MVYKYNLNEIALKYYLELFLEQTFKKKKYNHLNNMKVKTKE